MTTSHPTQRPRLPLLPTQDVSQIQGISKMPSGEPMKRCLFPGSTSRVSAQGRPRKWDMGAMKVGIGLALPAVLGLAMGQGAIAQSLPAARSTAEPPTLAQASPSDDAPLEIDSSITREYEPAVVYLPDPDTQELVPQSVLVTTDAPAAMAVDQIVQAYQGQDIGIQDYAVSVNPSEREAAINFEVEGPRAVESLQSLSSANQYSLFEAIRETLLTQPMYGVDEVIFQANDDTFDI